MTSATLSLNTAAARRLTTTVKSVPQTAEVTPRWLLRMLPWVELDAGTYRVNRKPSQAAIALAAGHAGEPDLPGTFVDYERMQAWRGVPLLPCEEHQGVIGLRPARLPDQHAAGISVRRCGLDAKGIARYLVSAYYSVAVLVPDALGILENAAIGYSTPSTPTEER